jgi:hypothetical protein
LLRQTDEEAMKCKVAQTVVEDVDGHGCKFCAVGIYMGNCKAVEDEE